MDTADDPDRTFPNHDLDPPIDYSRFDEWLTESVNPPYQYTKYAPACGLSEAAFERIARVKGFIKNELTGLWTR